MHSRNTSSYLYFFFCLTAFNSFSVRHSETTEKETQESDGGPLQECPATSSGEIPPRESPRQWVDHVSLGPGAWLSGEVGVHGVCG